MSKQVPRVFTTEFKENAVLRLEAGASASALASELGVRRKLLYDWRQAYREKLGDSISIAPEKLGDSISIAPETRGHGVIEVAILLHGTESPFGAPRQEDDR